MASTLRHLHWLAILTIGLSSNPVLASQVCHTNADGSQVCQNKISPAVGIAIGVTLLAVILLAVGVFFWIRRTRQARARVEATFNVETNQINGPRPVIGRGNTVGAIPAYAASYDTSIAPVRGSAGGGKSNTGNKATHSPALGSGSNTYTTFSNMQGPSSAPQGNGGGFLANILGGASTAPNVGSGPSSGKTVYPFVGMGSTATAVAMPKPALPRQMSAMAGYSSNKF